MQNDVIKTWYDNQGNQVGQLRDGTVVLLQSSAQTYREQTGAVPPSQPYVYPQPTQVPAYPQPNKYTGGASVTSTGYKSARGNTGTRTTPTPAPQQEPTPVVVKLGLKPIPDNITVDGIITSPRQITSGKFYLYVEQGPEIESDSAKEKKESNVVIRKDGSYNEAIDTGYEYLTGGIVSVTNIKNSIDDLETIPEWYGVQTIKLYQKYLEKFDNGTFTPIAYGFPLIIATPSEAPGLTHIDTKEWVELQDNHVGIHHFGVYLDGRIYEVKGNKVRLYYNGGTN